MPITAPDFVLRLSGGSANSNPAASLGGAKSATAYSPAINGLFDVVSGAESAAGRVEYRCVYLHNASATDTMFGALAWIIANTPLASTQLAIGVGTSAVNGVEQTVANETTAPAGVSFSEPASAAAGLALGDIPPGQHRVIWLRRTTDAGSASSSNDTWTIGLGCDTE